MHSSCKHRLSENLIQDLKLIDNNYNQKLRQKQRSQKKETSAKPATTAPPKGPEEKITAPKSTNNDFLKIPTEKKKPDKIQADSNQPPEQSSDADPPPTQSIR